MGQNRSKVEITANQVQFLTSKNGGNGDGSTGSDRNETPVPRAGVTGKGVAQKEEKKKWTSPFSLTQNLVGPLL